MHGHRIRLVAVLVPAVLFLTPTGLAHATGTESFQWVEATITDIHAAFEEGSLDCESLVAGYVARIEAYDDQGPALQSMITVNPGAMDQARELDAEYAEHGLTGPLHCVPLVLKDNIDTHDMPTTGGSLSLATSQPPDDAFLTRGLRAQGAIILGKGNMDEFAFGYAGSSSLGGQVRNPYDPTRGPGGSSSGTASAVAASLSMAGVGTDTGGSIRVPSSAQRLVGIRPSLRLVSQDGIMPLARFQDAAGPMCRTVEDCALLLDAMVGFDNASFSGQNTQPLQRDDEAERITSAGQYHAITGLAEGNSYTDALDADSLQGARIGVVRALFGTDPDVIAVVDSALEEMSSAGAEIEEVTIADLGQITAYPSVSRWEFRDHLTSYLQAWPSSADAHRRSFEEVAVSLQYEQSRVPTFAQYAANGATRSLDPDYETNTNERAAFVRPRLQAALDNKALGGVSKGEPFDVLLYPTVLSPPLVGSPPTSGSNNRLSPFSGFPTLTMPAGFTGSDGGQVPLPIGMELLAREFDESTLIRIAYAYQQAVEGTSLGRQAPTFTPELGAA